MDPLPDNSRATEIARLGFPDVDPTTITRQDFVFDFDVPADSFGVGDDATPGYVGFVYPVGFEHDELASLVSQAADRLRAQGWTVQPDPEPYYGSQLFAYNDTLVLQYTAGSADATIQVIRREPPSTGPLTVIGIISGAILGALVGLFGLRRLARSTPLVGLAIGATPVTITCSIPVGFGLTLQFANKLLGYPPDTMPLWGVYYLIPPVLFLAPIAILGAIAIVAAIGISFLVRDKSEPGSSTPVAA